MANSRAEERKIQAKPRQASCVESKDTLKEWWGHVKRTKKPAWRGSHWPNLTNNLSFKISKDKNKVTIHESNLIFFFSVRDKGTLCGRKPVDKGGGNDEILNHHWATIIRLTDSVKNHPWSLKPINLRSNSLLMKNITPQDSYCSKRGRK